MKVAGLFAGIGGFEIGLREAGHSIAMTCEKDPAAIAVLHSRFDFPNYDDIRSLKSLPSGVELVAAGFPCQDFSQAGKTLGISGAQSGLITEILRLLQATPAPWVLLENVPFMLRLRGGAALELIVAALEEMGYRWAYRVIDTIAWLPQRRHRWFLLASRVGEPADVLLADHVSAPLRVPGRGDVAQGFYWTEGNCGLGLAIDAIPPLKCGSGFGIPAPPAIFLPDGNIIKPDIRDAERLSGFDPDWTAPTETIARPSVRWRLIGNAVTVLVSKWIGSRLTAPGRYDRKNDVDTISAGGWPRAARSADGRRLAVNVSSTPVWQARPP